MDHQRVVEAILDCDVSPSAREFGSILVEAALEHYEEWPDSQHRILAVECPWYLWLNPKTLLIGVLDKIAQDDEGTLGSEWKSRREPKLKKDGQPWKGDDEYGWLQEISQGQQLAIYGLALHKGVVDINGAHNRMAVDNPRILVRACVKSNPPQFWPTEYERGVFRFSNELLEVVERALVSKAAQLRAARKLAPGHTPWQLPGLHCTNMYRRECQYLDSVCRPHLNPPDEPKTVFNMDDPGSQAIVAAGIDPEDRELVILSASAYSDASQCAELYRLNNSGLYPQEPDLNMEIGKVLHVGMAEIGRQIMLQQAEISLDKS